MSVTVCVSKFTADFIGPLTPLYSLRRPQIHILTSFLKGKEPRSSAARKRTTRTVAGLFSSLSRHKMLCLSADKIMPERHFCQAFCCFFYKELILNKSISYKTLASKCFKNRVKNMTLSLNFLATRYSGTPERQVLALIVHENPLLRRRK